MLMKGALFLQSLLFTPSLCQLLIGVQAIVIKLLCICGEINVMNFFVKGDNLCLCLYHVKRTFYLCIPHKQSTPRDSWSF